MPSISTCVICPLTALQRDCLICMNSIPQPCRPLQGSKCHEGWGREGRKRLIEGVMGEDGAASPLVDSWWSVTRARYSMGWAAFGKPGLHDCLLHWDKTIRVYNCIYLCSVSKHTHSVHMPLFLLLPSYCCVTHRSALTYSSSIGMQGTLPNLTPIWMSLNCRPKFSPRIVTRVPPWRGPVSGNN